MHRSRRYSWRPPAGLWFEGSNIALCEAVRAADGVELPRSVPHSGTNDRRSAHSLLHGDLERTGPLRYALDLEIDPSDLAAVRRLDLHFPLAGLIVRLHAVTAKALLASADDL